VVEVGMGGEEAFQHCDAKSSGSLVHTILDCYNLPCLLGNIAKLAQVCYARERLYVSVDNVLMSGTNFHVQVYVYNLMPSYISPSNSPKP
jgi:hypothetical protein